MVAQSVPHLFKAPFEELADFQVALAEFGLHLRQQRMDLAFGQGHDLRADFADPLPAGEIKRTDQHAGSVRMQGDVGALNVDGFHGRIGATARAG